jgi:aminomuconate-semialdehyde/2-hydroxymuconate-6-semialdehyde dehydrogenase
MKKIANFVNGVEAPPVCGEYFPTEDPAIGAPYALVPDSDEADLNAAVDAAEKAFPAWRDMGGEKRAQLLEKLADLVQQHFEEFVHAECVDTGKPLWLCRNADIPRAIANLRVYADAARKFSGEKFHKPEAKPATESYTLREPIGVVAVISPWNLPLLLFTWKIGPALAAGNCVIAKPSEVTPMTASMLGPLAAQAGFPAGVLNILHGKGPKIGAAITRHPKIAAISFTGGTATGTEIYSGAARMLKKVSLELGGKNPTVVFADTDFDLAVEGAKNSAFTNQGQICLCGSRIFVEKKIYPKFRDALVAKAAEIKPADPLQPETRFGAMVSRPHMEKVLQCMDVAAQEGAQVLLGGGRAPMQGRCESGYFLQPTDSERANRVAAKLESGTVWLNCWNIRDLELPFGGVKKSGVGREGKWRGMEFFTQEKTVTKLL